MMNNILKEQIGKTLLVYLDDVTIFTKTFEQHMQALRWVLERLREEGLFLKPKKCTIATEQMSFLGFIIDRQGLRTDPAKVEAVATFPRPTNKTEVRAFLGLATYYRRFVKNFAKVASPLNDMLRKDHDRIWR